MTDAATRLRMVVRAVRDAARLRDHRAVPWARRASLPVLALLCTAPMLPAPGPSAAPMTTVRDTAPATRERSAPPEPSPASTSSRSDTSPPSASPSPSPEPTVPRHGPDRLHEPRIRVSDVGRRAPEIARAVAGVASATAVNIGEVPVAAVDGGTREVRVLAGGLAGLRRLTPRVVADTKGVWQRLSEGAAAFTYESAADREVELGAELTMGHAEETVRVGALTTHTVPPLAEAVVNRATGRRLGLDTVPSTLLVAVTADADAQAVARRLERDLDAEAEVLEDPRAPRRVVPTDAVPGGTVWDRLAMCESSGDWQINSGNGYYGGLQFLPESWRMVGGRGLPHEASRSEQIHRAKLLHDVQGWAAWPVCSVLLGLRPAPQGLELPGS